MGGWWLTAIGTLITGFCYGLKKFLQWKNYKLPEFIAYYNDGIAYYFKTIFIMLLIRSFIVEWSIVPSESLAPTLLIGDRVLTDKAVYGIRLPITGHLIIPLGKPKRGDVVVFRSPVDSSSLIQRLIGLPGDRIQYRNKQLVINGKQVLLVELGYVKQAENTLNPEICMLYQENLEGTVHSIYTCSNDHEKKSKNSDMPIDIKVPYGHYFVMGDNRDRSMDSRDWGCISDRQLLGKANRIYLSRSKPTRWWKLHTSIRWERLGMKVNKKKTQGAMNANKKPTVSAISASLLVTRLKETIQLISYR